jgi:hypothetical protein
VTVRAFARLTWITFTVGLNGLSLAALATTVPIPAGPTAPIPVVVPPTPPPPAVKPQALACTNFDSEANCKRREQQEDRSRRAQDRAALAARQASQPQPPGASGESVVIEKVTVEADPEDRSDRPLSAQQTLERAWGDRTIPNGTIAIRGNDGTRVECSGAVLRNRQRLGLLSFLLPLPPCASSGDARPGYLKPSL